VTTLAGWFVFRNLPLTDGVVFTWLFVPVAQAAAVSTSGAAVRDWAARFRDAARAPLARPVLWIDVVMLSAGLILWTHPAMGFADAGVLQRRWFATKFIAAAGFLLWSLRDPVVAGRSGDRVTSIGAAIVIALVGLDGFVPWMMDATARLPPPLANQPASLLWLEVYGGTLAVLVWLVRRTSRQVETTRPAAAAAFRGASVAVFVGGLALILNGFLSLQPVRPWAAAALLAGTLGATALAVGAIAAGRRL
jgi:hypothetical protein